MTSAFLDGDITAIFQEFGGIHVGPDELDLVLEQHGLGGELRRTVPCPCFRIETMAPIIRCDDCGGIGALYPSDMREPMIAVMTGQTLAQRLMDAGHIVTGTVQFLFPTGTHPGEGDLFIPDDNVEDIHVVQEQLIRASMQVDRRDMLERRDNAAQRPPRPRPSRERLLYPEIIGIEAVYWFQPKATGGGRALRGVQGIDWVLRDDNRIQWLGDLGPAAGAGYTVRYRARAAYRLFPGRAVFRSEAGNAFPSRVIGMRLDRWGEPDHDREKAS